MNVLIDYFFLFVCFVNNRYSIECSERGLKLTSPGVKSKDEGFESDNDSVRSVKISDSVELDIVDLMDHLEIAAKEEKETETNSSSNNSSSANNNVPQLHSSLSSGGGSMDNTSISSSTGLHVSDDSNSSSSGNGSDSDEFCNSGESSPYWETLPNLSCFQSYPIEDVVFCHCDSQHPSTLVWVVRHLAKMMALVTTFRTRSEAEDLFSMYRDLRLKLKPIRYGKFSSHQGFPSKLTYGFAPVLSSQPSSSSSTPSPFSDMSSGSFAEGAAAFCSLPSVYPTEILLETQGKSPLFSVHDTASLDFDFDSSSYSGSSANTDNTNISNSGNSNGVHSNHLSSSKEPLTRTGSNSLSLHQHIYVSNPNIVRHEEAPSDDDDDDTGSIIRNDQEDFHHVAKHNHIASSTTAVQMVASSEADERETVTERFRPIPPEKPQRKLYKTSGGTISSMSLNNKHSLSSSSLPQMVSKSMLSTPQSLNSSSATSASTVALNASSNSNKPVLLVPLKNESVSSPKCSYPKESYLYHVMGRSSSTFAPYQRSLNFLPYQYAPGGGNNASGDYYAWGKGRHLLVPFSSWLELSEMPQIPHAATNSNAITSSSASSSSRHAAKTSRHSSRNSQRLAAAVAAASNNPKGTSKILLRDLSSRDHGVWASLSQRFKKNFRENLIPKLNGMWSQQPADGTRTNKKRTNKKVTFNAWATVQMV